MSRVFATSDWHGNLAVAEKVFEFLQPDDTLYFLGDCADRGKEGVMLAQMLLDDPRVKFIKGNHEIFMEEGLGDLINIGYPRDMNLWVYNGGRPTIEELSKMTDDELRILRAQLRQLPQTMIYRNTKGQDIILDHCGYTPSFADGNNFFYPVRHEPYWDRSHFFEHWDDAHFPNTYMIHGHTPVIFIEKEFNNWKGIPTPRDSEYDFRAYHYCDGHKICIDMGTFFSGRAVLLDLDSFEEIYIEEGE